jgi:hypothetical protein
MDGELLVYLCMKQDYKIISNRKRIMGYVALIISNLPLNVDGWPWITVRGFFDVIYTAAYHPNILYIGRLRVSIVR